MILQALVKYYESLAEQGRFLGWDGVVPKFPMQSICPVREL